MTVIQTVAVLWFASAIFIHVIGSFIFILWLETLGVRLLFGFAGVPGYAECAYRNWCRSKGRSPKKILILRSLSFANVVLSALIVIPIMTFSHPR